MKRDPLRRIVTEFRKGILGRRSSVSMCFAVCAPLQGYLSMLGYETQMIEGAMKYRDVGVNCEHYWLLLHDGRIIDPTADQFNAPGGSAMPKVYIGEKPKWYRVLEVK